MLFYIESASEKVGVSPTAARLMQAARRQFAGRYDYLLYAIGTLLLLQGTIVNRTYGTHKNLRQIYLFY